VLTSGILCLEHHDPTSMQEDIDFLIELEPDLIQFMLLTGLPATKLYLDLKEAGLLRWDLPFEEWHGQKQLNFRHGSFSGEQAEGSLQEAFDADYQRNGSSMGRLVETALRGVGTLQELAGTDEVFRARYEQLLDEIREYRPLLPTLIRFAVNERERGRMRDLDRRLREVLGPRTRKDIGLGLLALACATIWSWRLRLVGDRIQPRTLVTRYPA
jgi:hypothetical protein